jgi:hypothetical protein
MRRWQAGDWFRLVSVSSYGSRYNWLAECWHGLISQVTEDKYIVTWFQRGTRTQVGIDYKHNVIEDEYPEDWSRRHFPTTRAGQAYFKMEV